MTEVGLGRVETILEVGAEGGSITLKGRRASMGGWQFRVITSESALWDMLDEEPPDSTTEGGTPLGAPWIDSWRGALVDLGRYQWPRLRPL
jgi:hypothetical protein